MESNKNFKNDENQDKRKHPIESAILDTLSNLKEIIDVQTIVGKPIICNDNVSIIPITKVTIGYVGGGGEYFDVKSKFLDYPFAMGSGAGVNVVPIGFLVNEAGVVRYVSCERTSKESKSLELVINMIKQYMKNKQGETNEK